MWGMLPGDFSQAAGGQTLDHGVRPHMERGKGIFPVDSGDAVQEGEGSTVLAENPGSSSNSGVIVSENPGPENVADESERGWIPAYPGEYGEYEEDEAEATRGLSRPSRPSEEEVEEHCRAGHAQYRSWCEICIKAGGQEAPHPRNKKKKHEELPVISYDYGYLRDKIHVKGNPAGPYLYP